MPHRIERINHLIRQELSELLQRQIKDPRLTGLIAITEVDTSADLSEATVYVSCICTAGEREKIMRALASASTFMRGEMSRHLRLRHIPALSFCWDESIERGARILELIDKVCTDNNTDNKAA